MFSTPLGFYTGIQPLIAFALLKHKISCFFFEFFSIHFYSKTREEKGHRAKFTLNSLETQALLLCLGENVSDLFYLNPQLNYGV